MKSPGFRPLCSPFPTSLPGLKSDSSLPCCGALGKSLTFLSLTFCLCKIQIVIRIKRLVKRLTQYLACTLRKWELGASLVEQWLRIRLPDFPGGAVVRNPPANAGDSGSSPGLGRSHMPRSN